MAELTAIYDGQCEICNACVSWLAVLDRDRRIRCVPVEEIVPADLHPDLDEASCLAELQVIDAAGRRFCGWAAVLRIASILPRLSTLPRLSRRGRIHRTGDRLYRWVARNRLQLSACRGGSCRAANVAEVRRQADAGPFWTCYTLGLLLRLPLVAGVAARDQLTFIRDHLRTFRRRVTVLDGRLELWFLGGGASDLVPLAFGERFCAIWYRGALVDPGSPFMRPALARHLSGNGARVESVTATHAHEEHVGNLEWAVQRIGAPLRLTRQIEDALRPATRIPLERRLVIGQPPSLRQRTVSADDGVPIAGGRLDVLPAPGHSPEHVILWDPEERVALVGDSFMGAYFSSPNADVDSVAWIATLERLLELDVTVMVEGHGHVHTLRDDIPDIPGVVIRNDPKAALREKLTYLRWLRERIDAAHQDGMQGTSIVATCFPWGRRMSWERLFADEAARLFTRGAFSRNELIRSFHRQAGDVLPTVLEAHVSRQRQPRSAVRG